jgi:hypothetical protein
MINELISIFTYDSQNHPDKVRKSFYEALLAEINSGNDLLISLLERAQARGLKPVHLSNLLSHAFEYLFISSILNKPQEYFQFSVEDWRDAIVTVLSSDKLSPLVETILFSKSTQTNKYQRYLGPFILSSLIFGEQSILIADIGCSLNVGLMGLSVSLPFEVVEDFTSNQIARSFSPKKLNMRRGFGLDLVDPVQDIEWVLACSFYPSEIEGLGSLKQTLKELKNTALNVETVLGDLRQINLIWTNGLLPKVDIVIACTVLYQFTDLESTSFLETAKQILTPNGIIIINDFVNVQHNQLVWQSNKTFERNYRTVLFDGEQYLEFLCWENSRCTKVFEGKHFKKIIKMFT